MDTYPRLSPILSPFRGRIHFPLSGRTGDRVSSTPSSFFPMAPSFNYTMKGVEVPRYNPHENICVCPSISRTDKRVCTGTPRYYEIMSPRVKTTKTTQILPRVRSYNKTTTPQPPHPHRPPQLPWRVHLDYTSTPTLGDKNLFKRPTSCTVVLILRPNPLPIRT